jgi:adenylate cyclase
MGGAENKQRLAAILAADAAGYSRLMAVDDQATVATLDAARAVFRSHIESNQGRVADMAGDSVLAVFDTAAGAVTAALGIQQTLHVSTNAMPENSRMPFRIGVHLGDVIEKIDGTVYGDGVNIASRLQALAGPGGVMVSDMVHGAVRDRITANYEDAGDHKFKNIPRAVRAFRINPNTGPDSVAIGGAHSQTTGATRLRWLAMAMVFLVIAAVGLAAWLVPRKPDIEPADPAKLSFALPDRPSIAVLPFEYFSEDNTNGYFADGITDDIITDLSKVSGLFVIARNATFAYQGKPVTIRQVAEDLGVRYVLEGSVMESAHRIRITALLIDALKGDHIWAESYNRKLKDVFAIQSEIARKVSIALSVTINASEYERIFLKHTTGIEAYDVFLRARRMVDSVGREPLERAGKLFEQAIELDPGFAGAYAGLSFNYSLKARVHFTDRPEADAKAALEYARKAIELDKELAWGYIALGGARLALGDPSAAVDAVRRALAIQPGGYEANLFMGLYLQFAEQPGKAIEYLERAQRLNPVDTVRKLVFLGFAYFMNGDYEKSEAVFRKRMDKFPVNNELNYVFYAANLVMLGRTEDAARQAEMVLKLNPDFNLSGWRWIRTYKSPADRRHLYDAARRAGIPEYPRVEKPGGRRQRTEGR